MKKTFSFVFSLLLAGTLLLTGCGKSLVPEANPDETIDPAIGIKTYTMSVVAGKGGIDTKALSLDGSTLSATWAAGEQVAVYNRTKEVELVGYLEAQTDGASTTLQGTLTGDIEENDELTLRFLNPRYATQEGTLEYIAANCDHATADVTVNSIMDGSITTTAANFTNQQAIVKFKLRNKDNSDDLYASSLSISTTGNKLVTGKDFNIPSHYAGGYAYDGGTQGFNDDEGSGKLMDGNTGSKWCCNTDHKSGGIWYCEFHTDENVWIDGYTLTTGNDNSYSDRKGRNPKDWVLKAKTNAGDAWTTIASVTDDATMEDKDNTPYDFEVNAPGEYRFFRFEVSSTRGSDVLQLSELQLFKIVYGSSYGSLTITPRKAANELTVALCNENGGADTYSLIANVEGVYYHLTKNNVTFQNGKYYEITVRMEGAPEYADAAIEVTDLYNYVLNQPYKHISVSQAYAIAKYLAMIKGGTIAVVFDHYDSYGETVVDYALSSDSMALRQTSNCYFPYKAGYHVYIVPGN